jgi:hypothetical protein
VSYADITDGTRSIRMPKTYDDLDEMLDAAAASYRRALWNDQDVDVHLYSEKDAISGVIWPVTARYDVPLGVLRGYVSETFAWSVARSLGDDWPTYIYNLGDHDPSGVDAWQSFTRKVHDFAPDAAPHREHHPSLVVRGRCEPGEGQRSPGGNPCWKLRGRSHRSIWSAIGVIRERGVLRRPPPRGCRCGGVR